MGFDLPAFELSAVLVTDRHTARLLISSGFGRRSRGLIVLILIIFALSQPSANAIAAKEVGTVVAVSSGADGRITDCVIRKSSGSATLDRSACGTVMRQRLPANVTREIKVPGRAAL